MFVFHCERFILPHLATITTNENFVVFWYLCQAEIGCDEPNTYNVSELREDKYKILCFIFENATMYCHCSVGSSAPITLQSRARIPSIPFTYSPILHWEKDEKNKKRPALAHIFTYNPKTKQNEAKAIQKGTNCRLLSRDHSLGRILGRWNDKPSLSRKDLRWGSLMSRIGDGNHTTFTERDVL